MPEFVKSPPTDKALVPMERTAEDWIVISPSTTESVPSLDTSVVTVPPGVKLVAVTDPLS